VAGSTGLLGRATVARLLNEGARKVIGVDLESIETRNERMQIDPERVRQSIKDQEHGRRFELLFQSFDNGTEHDETQLQAQRDGRFVMHTGNITEADMFKEVFTSIDKPAGERLSLAVNCCGHPERRLVYGTAVAEMEHFDFVFNYTLTSAFNFVRNCAQEMAVGANEEEAAAADVERGLIINTTSILAKQGQKYLTCYSGAAGAVNAMTLPLSRDLAHCNIRVCAIAPGNMNNRYAGVPPGDNDWNYTRLNNAFPLRLGSADEFGQCVVDVFDNKMLNGEVIELSAGCRMPL